jgi:ABC-type protease/lipase transport system fused ATPase/permease subunit
MQEPNETEPDSECALSEEEDAFLLAYDHAVFLYIKAVIGIATFIGALWLVHIFAPSVGSVLIPTVIVVFVLIISAAMVHGLLRHIRNWLRSKK